MLYKDVFDLTEEEFDQLREYLYEEVLDDVRIIRGPG